MSWRENVPVSVYRVPVSVYRVPVSREGGRCSSLPWRRT